MKTVSIIQARYSSERLPGKVLLDICGKPMLWHIVQRIKYVKGQDGIVVAVSTNQNDQKIIKLCQSAKIHWYQGSEHDVLSRFIEVGKREKADIIIRVTGDNPLVEPLFIEEALKQFKTENLDYVSVKGCPLGCGIEVISGKALKVAEIEGKEKYHREHVTPYIYEHKERFKTSEYLVPEMFKRPELRLTVDEKEDLELIREIYNHLYREGQIVSLKEALGFLDKRQDMKAINKKIRQKLYKE